MRTSARSGGFPTPSIGTLSPASLASRDPDAPRFPPAAENQPFLARGATWRRSRTKARQTFSAQALPRLPRRPAIAEARDLGAQSDRTALSARSGSPVAVAAPGVEEPRSGGLASAYSDLVVVRASRRYPRPPRFATTPGVPGCPSRTGVRDEAQRRSAATVISSTSLTSTRSQAAGSKFSALLRPSPSSMSAWSS